MLDHTTSGTPVVEYTYDAWGNILTTTGSMASTFGVHNPLRYRGYVYDTELGLYYLQSRYYSPEMGRFLNADAFTSTGQGILGSNTFAYCANNPVNKLDSQGMTPIPIILPIIVGIGLLNNVGNAIAYESADEESDLAPGSYQEKYVSRWERVEYTKKQTGESHYNFNAWRYQSEYSLHEYGWYILGWAYEKGIPVISSIAASIYAADVDTESWDERWYVNIATIIWGLFGF